MADLYDLPSERAFITALCWLSLTEPQRAAQALDDSLVIPERMGDPAHAAVLTAMRRVLGERRPCDAATLAPALKGSAAFERAGGLVWLSEMLAGEGYEHQIAPCAESIRSMALRRALVAAGRDLTGRAGDLSQDPAETLRGALGTLSAITLSRRSTRTCLTMLEECVDEMEEVWTGKRDSVVRTGLPSLDAVIGGLQPTLIVIGALPGVGKSALLASIVSNVARAGTKVGVFSLEDEGKWLTWRFLARDAQIPQFVLRNRQLVPAQQLRVANAFDALKSYADNVLVDDRSCLTPEDVVQEARHMIVNHGVRALFVDHAGELRFKGQHQDRHDLELADALSTLRGIAKTHSVPIVVFAHLRRRQGLEPGDEPKLTDFANSSAFERKARIALGLSRVQGSDVMNVTLLKQTNGATSFRTSRGEMTNTIQLEFVGLDSMVRDVEGAIDDPYRDSDADESVLQ